MSACFVCGVDVPEGDVRCSLGHYQRGICVFCGTERPRNVAMCPRCGRKWPWSEPDLQEEVVEVAVAKPPRPTDAELMAATMRQPRRSSDEDAEPSDRAEFVGLSVFRRSAVRWRSAFRYATIVAIGIGLVGLASYGFGQWGSRAGSQTPTVAAITTTPQTITTLPAAQPQVSVATTNATLPTAPAVTTAPAPTTTAVPYVTPIGEALRIDDLRLTNDGIGSLRFGDPADAVAGVLAATFVQPDFAAPVEPAAAHPGACPGSASRVLRWGILEITLNNGVFAGYRLDTGLGASDSGTGQLRTASGLKLGATISTLETVYQSYHIVYGEKEGFGSTFSLQRASGEVLLWGPISSAEHSGVVLGVYSPSGC